MKVKATDKYEKLQVKDKELNRIVKEGEEFEISEERYKALTKTNKFNVAFVEKVEEAEVIEVARKDTNAETAIKKTRKRSK